MNFYNAGGQNNGGFENMVDSNAGMQQSVYLNQQQNAPQGGNPAPGFQCSCGKTFFDQESLHNHSFECVQMQLEGYASFAQGLSGLVNPMQQQQNGQSKEKKYSNLRSIFNMYVPLNCLGNDQELIQPKRASRKQNPFMNKFEEDKDDSMQIQEKSYAEQMFGEQPPGLQKNMSQGAQIQGDNMDAFLSMHEKERAATIYKQMQQLREESVCMFCNQFISEDDQMNQNLYMLQTTDCFHQVHVDCFKENIIKNMSESKPVKCPRCHKTVEMFECKQFLNEEDQKIIDKGQMMQILKDNPNLISCSCGNMMEMVAGQVIQGQKDDKGQPLSREAAEHMANFRIRCNECGKNFCVKCKAEPYHVGKTCDQQNASSCRFCGDELKQPSPSMEPAFKDVCRKPDCFALMQKSCSKMLPCGHPCRGCAGESKCPPCLEPECIEKMEPRMRPNVCADDFCTICYATSVGQEPVVQLDCGHIIHADCVLTQIQQRWNGPRMVFNYLDCPECKKQMKCTTNPKIAAALKKEDKLRDTVIKKALERAKFEDLHKEPRLSKPGDPFYNDLLGYAMKRLSYYQCYKCNEPYFGGMKDCEAAQNDYQNFKKEELVCGKCAAVSVGGGVKNCKTHGMEFIEYKCKFCCSIAQWFCWGNTHFCEPCHKKQCSGDYVSRKSRDQLPKCPGKAKCPLKVDHPPNGEEYALGCSLCRNMKDNAKNF